MESNDQLFQRLSPNFDYYLVIKEKSKIKASIGFWLFYKSHLISNLKERLVNVIYNHTNLEDCKKIEIVKWMEEFGDLSNIHRLLNQVENYSSYSLALRKVINAIFIKPKNILNNDLINLKKDIEFLILSDLNLINNEDGLETLVSSFKEGSKLTILFKRAKNSDQQRTRYLYFPSPPSHMLQNLITSKFTSQNKKKDSCSRCLSITDLYIANCEKCQQESQGNIYYCYKCICQIYRARQINFCPKDHYF